MLSSKFQSVTSKENLTPKIASCKHFLYIGSCSVIRVMQQNRNPLRHKCFLMFLFCFYCPLIYLFSQGSYCLNKFFTAGVVVVRVPGVKSTCPDRGNNLGVCDSPLHCDILSRDSARVQALQNFQHNCQRNKSWRGWGK